MPGQQIASSKLPLTQHFNFNHHSLSFHFDRYTSAFALPSFPLLYHFSPASIFCVYRSRSPPVPFVIESASARQVRCCSGASLQQTNSYNMTASDNGSIGNGGGNSNNGGGSSSGSGGVSSLQSSMGGLGLSPGTSPISPTSPPSAPLFNHSSQSIFNNPGIGSPASLLAVPYSNAGVRLHSFPSRSLSYSGGSGSALAIASSNVKAVVVAGSSSGSNSRGTSSDPAVKEVDDPTTPLSHLDKVAAPNTFSRLSATPTTQTTFGQSGRSYSYRGSQLFSPSMAFFPSLCRKV